MFRVVFVFLFLVATGLSAGVEISADSLRGHVSFLASDLLEGRDTPSLGLDIAAAYIAAQFRRAGLESVSGNDYYQTANWTAERENREGLSLRIRFADRIVNPASSQLTVRNRGPVDIEDATVVSSKLGRLDRFDAGQLRDAVLVIEIPDSREMGRRQKRQFARERQELATGIRKLNPALVLLLDPAGSVARQMERPLLVDPENPPPRAPPVMVVSDAEVVKLFRDTDVAAVRVSAFVAPAIVQAAPLNNVVGLLRGADESLAGTAVLVTAHYDHVGLADPGETDRVFNGANDNASGAAAVIEIAAALSRLDRKPRRSLLFVAFFGEERGMLGSKYYANHPVVPLDKTVAAINFEHLGRTDSDEGPQLRRATVTGFNLSDVAGVLAEAGKEAGVEFYRHPEASRAFFDRSDNISLAEKGVPAHTVAASLLYSDYHQPGDHWEKLDYDNMAAVTSAIALGIQRLADLEQAPEWKPGSGFSRTP